MITGITKSQLNNMGGIAHEQSKLCTSKDTTPQYYGAKCKCGRKIDWYVIGDLYNKGKGEAWSHAGKKLLRAGEGHKPLLQDIDEVIDTLNRWKEQLFDKDSV